MEQKPKKLKPERPRSKVSFAIDRDEIDISTEWVQAVMVRPVSAPEENNATVETIPGVADSLPVVESPAISAVEALDPSAIPLVLTDTATVVQDDSVVFPPSAAESATHADHSALAETVAVEREVLEILNDTVEEPSTVVLSFESEPENTTVAILSTDEPSNSVEQHAPISRPVSTVGKGATGVQSATVVVTYENQTTRQFRPRPIRGIADGLTPGQMAVYHLMFQGGEAKDAEGRLYQGGYADLCALTGMSKRGIQNVIGDLKAKTCIDVYQQPGYHRSQMTTYRVFSETTILNTWKARGIQYAIGKGKDLVIDPGKPEIGWSAAAT